MTAADDRRFMRQALRLGRRFVGATAPNPAVGAVVVQGGRVVGRGAHERAGTPHAEIHALAEAGALARGATVYVTLEPCSHHGRTPPCADALIAAGVARVVIGSADPNPAVDGRGVARLRAAGIAVTEGVLATDCDDLLADFRTWVTHRRPFVIHKAALTLDGATASQGGGREPVSGPASRRAVQRLRAAVDAVVVGSGTWYADAPDLRPRGVGARRDADGAPHRPWRVAVAGTVPRPAGPMAEHDPERTWWIAGADAQQQAAAWRDLGARVTATGGTRPGPQQVLQTLWLAGVHRVLLEGGATLARSFLDAERIDWLVLIYGAKLAGGRPDVPLYAGDPTRPLDAARRFVPHTVRRRGDDVWIEGPMVAAGREK